MEITVLLMQALEMLMNKFETLPVLVQGAAVLLGGIITTANALTSVTPSKVDDEKWGKAAKLLNPMLSFLNFLAVNIGKNKNADTVPDKKEDEKEK